MLRGVHALHGRAQLLQLDLRLLPLALVDQGLDLLHLGLGSEHHGVVADALGAEQGLPRPVKAIAGARTVDGRAETADTQDRRSCGADEDQRSARMPFGQTIIERCDRVTGGDRNSRRRTADAVTPVRQQECQLRLGGVGRVHGLTRGEGLDEPV